MYARSCFLIPLPVLVKQTRKACTPQKGPVKLIKCCEEGIWCLFPTPLPPSPEAQLTELVFGFGYWGRMGPVSGALLSILVAMASSPVPLGSFDLHFPPESFLLFPWKKFCLLRLLCSEGGVYNYTIAGMHNEKRNTS